MILEHIKKYAKDNRVFYKYKDKDYSYKELDEDSDRIASYLKRVLGEDKRPIVVYGHKDPLMIAVFLGCVKSGRSYCPVDSSTPRDRVLKIIDKVGSEIVFTIDSLPVEKAVGLEEIKEIVSFEKKTVSSSDYVKEEDLYYIIFTSGSTGEPKGVMIRLKNVEAFTRWIIDIGKTERDSVILNQAPFSFDLSVMDLYMALGSGSILYVLDKESQSDYPVLMEELKKSKANIWVSTPSFADLCLAERNFQEDLLPNLHTFLFCGEILTNKTAKKLKKRFPKARIINTYGPTESTVCVTSIEITEDIIEHFNPLPIGKPKPGTILKIMKEAKEEKGEIMILGDTVGLGYYKSEELTGKVFGKEKDSGLPFYLTGDIGFQKEGYYFCGGRIDDQIKMHGYRIELSDIEKNMDRLEEIEKSCVIPFWNKGKVQRLTAFIVYKGSIKDENKRTLKLKELLGEYLQKYMIPQRFVYIDALPINRNGKIDRKQLIEY